MLEERGARVSYAECYRRARPQGDPGALLQAWARGEVHAVSGYRSLASSMSRIASATSPSPTRSSVSAARARRFSPSPQAGGGGWAGLRRRAVAATAEQGLAWQETFDFGTGGLNLAYEVMRGYDAMVLVDASRQGGEPGTLYVMEPAPADVDDYFVREGEVISGGPGMSWESLAVPTSFSPSTFERPTTSSHSCSIVLIRATDSSICAFAAASRPPADTKGTASARTP